MDASELDESTHRARFSKHISASLSSAIIVRVLAIVLVKVLTILLPIGDFGIYSLWIAFALFVSMVATSPYAASIWRFMQKWVMDDKNRASRFFTTCLLGSFVFLVSIFLGLFLLQILYGFMIVVDSTYSYTLLLVGLLTSMYVLREIILVISGSEQNAREIFAYSIAYAVSSTLVACYAAYSVADYRVVLIGLLIGFSIPILISLLIKVKQYGILKPHRSDVKEVMVFGGPYMVIRSATASQTFVASFFLSIWVGFSEVALLSVGIALAGILALVIGPAMMAYRAYITNVYETGNLEKGNILTTKVIELFIVVSSLLVLLVIRTSDILIELISTSEYLAATIILPFVLVSVLVKSFSDFWRFRLDLAKKTQITAIIHVSGLIALIVSCILFLQLYGFLGIGIALMIHAFTILILSALAGNRYLPIEVKRRFVVVWYFSFILMLLIEYALQLIGVHPLISLILSIAMYGLLLIFTGILKKEEIRMVIRFIMGY